MNLYRKLVLAALLLTLVLVSLGAYVRLSDAGLGCPDWPGCYGKLTPGHAAAAIDAELAARPHGPVSHAKAWKEMVHRYVAGTLGLLVLAIAALAWRLRRDTAGTPLLPTFLLAVVGFQALLGMWTVTLLLKPLVVTAHLLGGLATLSLLLWLWLRETGRSSHAYFARVDHLRAGATVAVLLVVVQIALGGWVSSNYAALACTDYPLCQGQWRPPMDFAHAFTLRRELGETAAGDLLPLEALTAIHWTHRWMALVVAVYLGWLVLRLLRTPGYAGFGLAIGALLLAQLTLGISNVLLSLPLGVAVAHHAGAALLLCALVWLNHRVRRR